MRMAGFWNVGKTITFDGFAKTAQPPLARPVTY